MTVRISATDPVYSIGITATMLQVCSETLRIWERKGLIKPSRIGKNRYYSRCDLDKLRYIKNLIQHKKINIEGVKEIIKITRCWEIKNCPPVLRRKCVVYNQQTTK